MSIVAFPTKNSVRGQPNRTRASDLRSQFIREFVNPARSLPQLRCQRVLAVVLAFGLAMLF